MKALLAILFLHGSIAFNAAAESEVESAPQAESSVNNPASADILRERKAWRDALDQTSWDITLKPSNHIAEETITDTLFFHGRKLISAYLAEQGFQPANYSLRVEAGRMIWETMQSHEETNRKAFLRGVVDAADGSMSGDIDLEDSNGRMSYNFRVEAPLEGSFHIPGASSVPE